MKMLLPQLDWVMEKGMIIKWLKEEGNSVEKGEPIYLLHTGKTTVEIEAAVTGILKKIVPEKTTVPVGDPVCVIVEPGEEEIDLEAALVRSTEPIGDVRVIETEKGEIERPARKIRATPLAKRIAKEHNIDLVDVQPSDPGGLISKDDVLRMVEQKREEIVEDIEVIPIDGFRKIMFDRVSYVNRTYGSVTTFAEADVTELVNLRKNLKEHLMGKYEINLTYTPFIIKAVCESLKEYPIINSSIDENKIIVKKFFNIGIAIERERQGLIVPVIHEADKKNIIELSQSIKHITEKAQENRFSIEDLTGGTFTISNVGMLGVYMNTPIINAPESAILGVGAILDKPAVIGEKIEVRKLVKLCLTYDHRIIDGGPAVRFLQKVRHLLENPHRLLQL